MRQKQLCSALAVALSVFCTTTAQPATLDEASVVGGAFGSQWNAPTIVGAGITKVIGTGNGNQYDNLAFLSLPSGAQTLTFDFSAPSGIGWSYAAGGSLLYSLQPFRWGWDGTTLASFGVGYAQPTTSVTLNLGPAFSGALYLALNFTYGSNLGYSISIPSNAVTAPPPLPTPSAVPLPAGGGMLSLALGFLGAGAGVSSIRRRLR